MGLKVLTVPREERVLMNPPGVDATIKIEKE
jgi:hypothetical protein